MTPAAAVEQRAHPREEVLRPGVIVHGRSGRSLPCTIIDISAGGARLLLDAPDLPEKGLTLIDQRHHSLADCGVVWRKGNFVGVMFTPPAESAARKEQLRRIASLTSPQA